MWNGKGWDKKGIGLSELNVLNIVTWRKREIQKHWKPVRLIVFQYPSSFSHSRAISKEAGGGREVIANVEHIPRKRSPERQRQRGPRRLGRRGKRGVRVSPWPWRGRGEWDCNDRVSLHERASREVRCESIYQGNQLTGVFSTTQHSSKTDVFGIVNVISFSFSIYRVIFTSVSCSCLLSVLFLRFIKQLYFFFKS